MPKLFIIFVFFHSMVMTLSSVSAFKMKTTSETLQSLLTRYSSFTYARQGWSMFTKNPLRAQMSAEVYYQFVGDTVLMAVDSELLRLPPERGLQTHWNSGHNWWRMLTYNSGIQQRTGRYLCSKLQDTYANKEISKIVIKAKVVPVAHPAARARGVVSDPYYKDPVEVSCLQHRETHL